MKDELAIRIFELLLVLFGAGALIIAAGRRIKPGAGPSRIWTTYFVELGIIAVVLVPAYFGAPLVTVAALAIGAAAQHELYSVIARTGLTPRRGSGAIAGLSLIAAAGFAPHLLAPVAALGALLLIAEPLLTGRIAGAATSVGATTTGVLYPCVGLAHLALLARRSDGFGHIVFLYALLEINDSFALLAGAFLGKRKLWPRISPKKTVAGALAGLLSTIAGALAFRFAVPSFSIALCLAMGLLLGVTGQLGDLVASSFKRDAGVKDYSDLIPTQGGVLDVYDSTIFAAPLYYHLIGLFLPDGPG